MTTARDVYAKVSADLRRAIKAREVLQAQLGRPTEMMSKAESELRTIAWRLLPEACDALPDLFGNVSEALSEAEARLRSSSTSLEETNSQAIALKETYEKARNDFGTQADTAREAMRDAPDYRRAEKSIADTQAVMRTNGPKLAAAEKQLARLNGLAKESFVHRTLLSVRPKGEDGGHFLVSLWHMAGRGLKDTNWFSRMDADRAAAERDVQTGREVRDRAIMEGSASKACVQKLNQDFEASLQPGREALQKQAIELEDAEKAVKDAELHHQAASRHLSDLQAGRAEPAISARSMLAKILGRPFGKASQNDFRVVRALADRPAAAELVARAMELSEEWRTYGAERRAILEKIDAARGAISELEKVESMMARKRLDRSSRRVENVDTFMMTDISGGFDLETLTPISVISQALSNISSSSSDWSSGSDTGTSSSLTTSWDSTSSSSFDSF
jgi:hypothetical protein